MSKRGQQNIARHGSIREPYDRVLIVCEGEKTEPHYFEKLIELYRLSVVNVVVSPSPDSDPQHVVAYAQKQYSLKEYDRVYCVFDRDTHSTFNDAVNSVRTALPADVFSAITSNPCFEVWLLLHFEYTAQAFTSCTEVITRLRTHLSGYAKGNISNIASIIDAEGSKIATALINAQRLELENSRTQANTPNTQAHLLVEYLQNIKNPQKPMQVRASQLLEEMVDTSKPHIVASHYRQLQTIFNGQPQLLEQIGDVWWQIEECAHQYTVLSDETKVAIWQKIEELRQP